MARIGSRMGHSDLELLQREVFDLKVMECRPPYNEVAFLPNFPKLGIFEPSVYRELPIFACYWNPNR